ncbi:sulfite exporter TauE/SafE family protein [Adlercreutzia agrestimuris]|uniref:sulfite exporter TauE/SafE family protein n=1 Tax=Adlercreutzia agrestimuris TaxID=2941324 RepID=UPI00203C00C6|nr:sulfite exporter TauE/SafE family protein [Adlercreutzia agrestimuris]
MELFVQWVVPALVGVGIGVLSGLLGVGGGTIMVPVFRLVFDMSPIMSTATSLFTIVPTSISGAVSHVRNKTCLPALGVAAGLGGALTSPLGVQLASISPAWLIMVVAALVIIWSAINILSKAIKAKPVAASGAAPAQADAVESADANAATGVAGAAGAATGVADAAGAAVAADAAGASTALSRKQLLLGACIGLAAGLASGYVGVGGGFLMVPLFLSVIGVDMRKASGTSLIAVMILAIPGVIQQAFLGNINYVAGIAIALGSIPGALLGAKLITRVPERTLRFIFGGFLLVAAVILVCNEFGILG